MPLAPVDRLAVTTVVDNSVDILRPDEKVARRWGVPRARKIADLRAEHGLAHYVEVTRGRETGAIGFDFGLTEASMTHNFRELGLDAGKIDALALSHGHSDHFGGLLGFLSAYRRQMRPDLRFYGHPNHYVARWMEREGDRVSLGRLDRDDVARWSLDVVDVPEPHDLAGGRASFRRDADAGAVRGDPTVPAHGGGRRPRPGHLHRRADADRPRPRPRAGRRDLVLPPRDRRHLPPRGPGQRRREDPRGDRRLPPLRARRGADRPRRRRPSAASRSITSCPSTARARRPSSGSPSRWGRSWW